MKDLAEHIRTVHFTVLVIALILTAALQIEKKRSLERAASDAEALRQLSVDWGRTQKSVDLALSASLDAYRKETRDPEAIVGPASGYYTVTFKAESGSDSSVDIVIRKPWMFRTTAKGFPMFLAGEEQQWSTLKSFKAFWDTVHDGSGGYLPIVLITGDDRGSCVRLDANPRPRMQTAFLTDDFKQVPSTELNVWETTPVVGDSCRFQKLRETPLKINLSSIFASLVPQAKNWSDGTSEAEFHDLLAESKYLEDVPLTTLAAALRERANADTERIELFQAKIPASAIPTFGSFLLLLAQAYLLFHLREFLELMPRFGKQDFPVGYIGFYGSPSSAIFTASSLIFFPLVPLIMEAKHGEGKVCYLSILAGCISVALSVGCSSILLNIRRQLRNQEISTINQSQLEAESMSI